MMTMITWPMDGTAHDRTHTEVYDPMCVAIRDAVMSGERSVVYDCTAKSTNDASDAATLSAVANIDDLAWGAT